MTLTAPVRPPQAAPIEPTTPIRPSEAIRLGCLIAPVQCFEDYGWAAGSACALGAMSLGFGYGDTMPPAALDRALSLIPAACPEHGSDGDSLDGVIPHLNDDHHWSRERIASWLESCGL